MDQVTLQQSKLLNAELSMSELRPAANLSPPLGRIPLHEANNADGYYFSSKMKPPSVIRKDRKENSEKDAVSKRNVNLLAIEADVLTVENEKLKKDVELTQIKAKSLEDKYEIELASLKSQRQLQNQLFESKEETLQQIKNETFEKMESQKSKLGELTEKVYQTETVLERTTKKLEQSLKTNRLLIQQVAELDNLLKETQTAMIATKRNYDALDRTFQAQKPSLADYEEAIEIIYAEYPDEIGKSFPVTGILSKLVKNILNAKKELQSKNSHINQDKEELRIKLDSISQKYLFEVEQKKLHGQIIVENNDLISTLRKQLETNQRENIQLSKKVADLESDNRMMITKYEDESIDVRSRALSQLKETREQFEKDRIEAKMTIDKLTREKVDLQTEIGSLLRDRRSFTLEMYRSTRERCCLINLSQMIDNWTSLLLEARIWEAKHLIHPKKQDILKEDYELRFTTRLDNDLIQQNNAPTVKLNLSRNSWTWNEDLFLDSLPLFKFFTVVLWAEKSGSKMSSSSSMMLDSSIPIGKVTIPFSSLPKGGSDEKWYVLQDSSLETKISGKLQVSIEYMRSMKSGFSVSIIQGKDIGIFHKDISPFVVLHLLPDKLAKSTEIGRVVEGNDPLFSEGFFFPVNQDSTVHELHISVWNETKDKKHPLFLGQIYIPLAPIMHHKPVKDKWYSLDTLPNDSIWTEHQKHTPKNEEAIDSIKRLILTLENSPPKPLIPVNHCFVERTLLHGNCIVCKQKLVGSHLHCTSCTFGIHQKCEPNVGITCGGAKGQGLIKIGLKLSKTVVLDITEYSAFLNLLQQDDFSILLAEAHIEKGEELAETLYSILNATYIDLIKQLIKKTFSNLNDPVSFFRGNDLAAKAVFTLLKNQGLDYLKKTLTSPLSQIVNSKKPFEIDESKMDEKYKMQWGLCDLDTNMQNFCYFLDVLMNAILTSLLDMPSSLREIFQAVRANALLKFPDDQVFKYSSVSGLLFLRFINPAIILPSKILGSQIVITSNQQRKLLLITKVLQNLANFTPFQNKEACMLPLNNWLSTRSNQLKEIIDQLVNEKSALDRKAFDEPAEKRALSCSRAFNILNGRKSEICKALPQKQEQIVQVFKELEDKLSSIDKIENYDAHSSKQSIKGSGPNLNSVMDEWTSYKSELAALISKIDKKLENFDFSFQLKQELFAKVLDEKKVELHNELDTLRMNFIETFDTEKQSFLDIVDEIKILKKNMESRLIDFPALLEERISQLTVDFENRLKSQSLLESKNTEIQELKDKISRLDENKVDLEETVKSFERRIVELETRNTNSLIEDELKNLNAMIKNTSTDDVFKVKSEMESRIEKLQSEMEKIHDERKQTASSEYLDQMKIIENVTDIKGIKERLDQLESTMGKNIMEEVRERDESVDKPHKSVDFNTLASFLYQDSQVFDNPIVKSNYKANKAPSVKSTSKYLMRQGSALHDINIKLEQFRTAVDASRRARVEVEQRNQKKYTSRR